MRDTLYLDGVGPSPFVFDATVATVFADMIARSVPGYDLILQQLAVIAGQHLDPSDDAYDLGCSLGASAAAMYRGQSSGPGRIVAVDSSSAMVAEAQTQIADFLRVADMGDRRIDVVEADITAMDIGPCGLVTLNFVLQFVPIEHRDVLLQTIAKALKPGGILVLSEKIAIPKESREVLRTMHEGFKLQAGYSTMEIAAKRQAIENVLVPESDEVHRQRLLQAGFREVHRWFQAYSFVSYIAVR